MDTPLQTRAGARAMTRPRLEDRDHEAWRGVIVKLCGLELGVTRRDYLARRLWRRMETLGLKRYDDYLDRVVRDPMEWRQLLELLVNRETSFFRHPPSFDALRQILTRRLTRDGAAGRSQAARLERRRLDLWSAGCSTGQEPYSLAMCALDTMTACGARAEVRITAGDVSEQSLSVVGEGRYTERQMKAVPAAVRRLYFRREETSRGPVFQVRNALRRVVATRPWNLSRPETYLATRADVIFCQNLLIYVPRDHRPKVVQRLSECLRPGGTLFLAPGEVLGLRLPGLELTDYPDCLAYRRTV